MSVFKDLSSLVLMREDYVMYLIKMRHVYFKQISSVTGKVCGCQLVQIRFVFSMRQLLCEGKRASERSKLKETLRNIGLR